MSQMFDSGLSFYDKKRVTQSQLVIMSNDHLVTSQTSTQTTQFMLMSQPQTDTVTMMMLTCHSKYLAPADPVPFASFHQLYAKFETWINNVERDISVKKNIGKKFFYSD